MQRERNGGGLMAIILIPGIKGSELVDSYRWTGLRAGACEDMIVGDIGESPLDLALLDGPLRRPGCASPATVATAALRLRRDGGQAARLARAGSRCTPSPTIGAGPIEARPRRKPGGVLRRSRRAPGRAQAQGAAAVRHAQHGWAGAAQRAHAAQCARSVRRHRPHRVRRAAVPRLGGSR
jgi:hypothetical protein